MYKRKYKRATRRKIMSHSQGEQTSFTDKKNYHHLFSSPPDFVQLTEELEETFERNHPHLYHVLNRALWQNYGARR